MSINKNYAVIGLGRYGSAVATELVQSGVEVLAVDINENIANDMAALLPVCKCADITDPDVVEQLGMSNIDVAVIAMAKHLEASVMAIMLCKEAGVKNVIAKCVDDMHGKIFERVGADKVVYPEKESGTRLAKNLLSSGFVDMVELNKDVSMVELPVNEEWIGKNLIDLRLRKRYGINVVAIRNGERVEVSIDPEQPLSESMKLIVIANTAKLARLNKK